MIRFKLLIKINNEGENKYNKIINSSKELFIDNNIFNI